VIKFDQQFGSKHHLFFRHGSNDCTQMASDNSNAIVGPGARFLARKRLNDAYVLIGSASSRREPWQMRVSFARYLDQDHGDQNQGYDPTKLGFPRHWRRRFREGHSRAVCHLRLPDARQYPTGSITNWCRSSRT
jgi:hypothetical protein